tara:strand:- start:720 stop:926 length:207 start_codon:yes stop_codon:yes gene_type:complete
MTPTEKEIEGYSDYIIRENKKEFDNIIEGLDVPDIKTTKQNVLDCINQNYNDYKYYNLLIYFLNKYFI